MQLRDLNALPCTDWVQEMQPRSALHGLGAGNATTICSAWIGCRKCSSEPSLNCTARMQRRKCNPELHCMDAVQEMQSRAALQGLGAGNATAICSARIGCRKCNRELPCLDWVQEMQLRDLNALRCKDGVQEMRFSAVLHHAARMGCRKCSSEPSLNCTARMRCRKCNYGRCCTTRHGWGRRKCNREPSLNCTALMQCRKCNPELLCTDWVQEMQL